MELPKEVTENVQIEVPKNKLLEQAENSIWIWKETPTKLKDLHYNQLCSILETIKKHNRNWFGQSVDFWQKSITLVIRHNYLETYRNSIRDKNARIVADNFLKNFKLFNS